MSSKGTSPLLSVSGLNVRYGPLPAVQDVDLQVAEGEVVAILGVNGAGKSSVLNAISGLVGPASGSVVFDGEDVARRSPEAIVGRGLALSPEGRRIFAGLTVAENLRLAAGFMKRTVLAEREAELFELFPILKDRTDTLGGNLSGGQQQQLALARALIRRPKMLLLDEPSLGLAPKLIGVVFDLMHELRSRGITMLLVEQNVQRTLELADRGYALQSGRVVLQGTAAELESADLESAYLGISTDEPGQTPEIMGNSD